MNDNIKKGILYIVGTPIGNLSDITLRCLEKLKNVDFIAAEDTRVTIKLLNHYEIKKPLISCHEYTHGNKIKDITQRIFDGENCALVSDAGMPCISDPGIELINACIQADIPVEVIPGATALTAALSVSGLNTTRFSFEGFLSTNKTARTNHLNSLKNSEYTMVFYEAPHKLLRTLNDMYSTFGDRNIVIAKELTKIHENVFRTVLSKAIEYYNEKSPKGEYVIIINKAEKPPEKEYTLSQAAEIATEHIENGMSRSQAAKTAAKQTKHPRSEIYKQITTNN